jgi:hypothetical protein
MLLLGKKITLFIKLLHPFFFVDKNNLIKIILVHFSYF